MNRYYLQLKPKTSDIVKKSWVNPLKNAEGNFIDGRGPDYASEIFTDEFLEKVNSIGPVRGILLFHKDNFDPNWGAHVDIIKYTDEGKVIRAMAALNVVFDEGVDVGTMQWFDLKVDVPDEDRVKFTNINSLYLEWPPEELELVEECTILEHPALVRTNLPHTVRTGDARRTCVSIRFDIPCDTWEELYDLFDKAFNQSN